MQSVNNVRGHTLGTSLTLKSNVIKTLQLSCISKILSSIIVLIQKQEKESDTDKDARLVSATPRTAVEVRNPCIPR